MDNFVDFINDDLVTLDELGIPRKRNNLDKIKNGYGNKLLEFCKGNNGLPEVNILQNEPINEHINAYISKEEILKCIQKLKNDMWTILLTL